MQKHPEDWNTVTKCIFTGGLLNASLKLDKCSPKRQTLYSFSKRFRSNPKFNHGDTLKLYTIYPTWRSNLIFLKSKFHFPLRDKFFPPEDWLLASWSTSLSPAPHWLLDLQCWAFWVSLRRFHAASLLLALLDSSFLSQNWKHRAFPTWKRPFKVFPRCIWVISLMIWIHNVL